MKDLEQSQAVLESVSNVTAGELSDAQLESLAQSTGLSIAYLRAARIKDYRDAQWRAQKMQNPEVAARVLKWMDEPDNQRKKVQQDRADFHDQTDGEIDRTITSARLKEAVRIVEAEYPLLADTDKNRRIILSFLEPQQEYLSQWPTERMTSFLRAAIISQKDKLDWTTPASVAPVKRNEVLLPGQLRLRATQSEMRAATIPQLKDLAARRRAAGLE